jgi:predicted enzyme related to lactoylglutathione lyase
LLEQGDTPPQDDQQGLAATGLRYLTLQVFDCDAAYAEALGNGAKGEREPVTLGTTARIAFIRDPDGVWIELSERASVTGKPVA